MTTTNADAEVQAFYDRDALRRFARGVSRLSETLEQAAGQAREKLADPRLADPDLAAVREYLLRACRTAGAVADDVEAAP